jgi:hypothetical protein
MATDDNTLFTVLFDGSPAKGAEALMEGFKRSYPGAWATLETLQRRQIKAAVEDQVERGGMTSRKYVKRSTHPPATRARYRFLVTNSNGRQSRSWRSPSTDSAPSISNSIWC